MNIAFVFISNDSRYVIDKLSHKYSFFDKVFLIGFSKDSTFAMNKLAHGVHVKMPYPNIVSSLEGLNDKGLEIYAKRIFDLLELNEVIDFNYADNHCVFFYDDTVYALIAHHLKKLVHNKQVIYLNSVIEATPIQQVRHDKQAKELTLEKIRSFINSADLIICSTDKILNSVRDWIDTASNLEVLPHRYISLPMEKRGENDQATTGFIKNLDGVKPVLYYADDLEDDSGLVVFLEAVQTLAKTVQNVQLMIGGVVNYQLLLTKYPLLNVDCMLLGAVADDVLIEIANRCSVVLNLPSTYRYNSFLLDLAMVSNSFITTEDLQLSDEHEGGITYINLKDIENDPAMLSELLIQQLMEVKKVQKAKVPSHLNGDQDAFRKLLFNHNTLKNN